MQLEIVIVNTITITISQYDQNCKVKLFERESKGETDRQGNGRAFRKQTTGKPSYISSNTVIVNSSD